jgi:hypothetical protein
MELILWQNLIFFVPLVAGALYTLLLTLSGMSDLGADASDGAAEVDLDADADADADVEHSALSGVLDFFGVGRVPLSILLTSLTLLWGTVGLVSNLMLGLNAIGVSLTAAALAALFGTRTVGRLIARLLPSVESYHTTRAELWGETGLALYSVTAQGGTVRLRDRRNNLLDLECRTFPGEETIPSGSRVRLEEYDAARDVYLVRAVVEE